MISKTRINERMKRKTNLYLEEAIFLAKKKNLIDIAAALSSPARQEIKVNIEKIEKEGKDAVIIPGKVLGTGEIKKKVNVCAFSFSKDAKEKIKKAGGSCIFLLDALKENKKLEGHFLT